MDNSCEHVWKVKSERREWSDATVYVDPVPPEDATVVRILECIYCKQKRKVYASVTGFKLG